MPLCPNVGERLLEQRSGIWSGRAPQGAEGVDDGVSAAAARALAEQPLLVVLDPDHRFVAEPGAGADVEVPEGDDGDESKDGTGAVANGVVPFAVSRHPWCSTHIATQNLRRLRKEARVYSAQRRSRLGLSSSALTKMELLSWLRLPFRRKAKASRHPRGSPPPFTQSMLWNACSRPSGTPT